MTLSAIVFMVVFFILGIHPATPHPLDPALWLSASQNTTETLFRVAFRAPPTAVSSAILSVSGIGVFESSLNGIRVAPRSVMDPGTTDFARLSLFTREDVSTLIQPGVINIVGIRVGNGWYGMRKSYDAIPKLIVLLVVDGNIVVASGVTNTTTPFRMSPGPIVSNSIYDGETYNQSAEIKGWDLPSFNDSAWPIAKLATDFHPTLALRDFPPITVNESIPYVATWSPAPGVSVYDFGRAMSGVCNVSVSGTHGTVTLRHGEILDHYTPGQDRFVYFVNLGSAKATDVFMVANGTGGESHYMPRFTYHGFRFVQVTTTGDVQLRSLTALSFFTSVTPTSSFSTNNALTNTLHQHILWGQAANLMSYPTDCNQRNERLGWMADAWLSSAEASTNFDMHSFYRSYIRSIVLEQQTTDGAVMDITPNVRGWGSADPSWGLALPYLVRLLAVEYADIDTAQQNYAACVAWLNCLRTYALGGLPNMFFRFGDWLPPPPAVKVSGPFTASWALLYTNEIMVELATMLGHSDDAANFSSSLASYRSEFTSTFFHPSNKTFDIGTVQGSFVLPMSISGLVGLDVAEGLVELVAAREYHLDTGILSHNFLYDALVSIGRSDVAVAILLQTDYPSYAYMWEGVAETAATGLWELWNAPAEIEPTGNSRNHVMNANVDTFLFRHVSGLGSGGVRIHSAVANSLTPIHAAHASRRTSRGATVSVTWRRDGGAMCHQAIRPQPLRLSCGPEGGVIVLLDVTEQTSSQGGLCYGYGAHTELSELARALCVGKSECVVPYPNQSVRSFMQCSQPYTYYVAVEGPAGTEVVLPTFGIASPRVEHGSCSSVVDARGVYVLAKSNTGACQFVVSSVSPVSYITASLTSTGMFRANCSSGQLIRMVQRWDFGSLRELHVVSAKCDLGESCEASTQFEVVCG